jgi:ferredoxin-like protein FixX
MSECPVDEFKEHCYHFTHRAEEQCCECGLWRVVDPPLPEEWFK